MLTRFVLANLKDVNIKGVKVKIKFTLEKAAKAQRERRGMALLFL